MAAPTRKKKGGARAVTISVLVLLLLLAALPTAILLAVGLVPTLVALIVDMTPGRYLARCVAGVNIAGLAPLIQKLWLGGNSVSGALAIVGDPYAWLVIYSAAAIGWLLFLGLPGAVALFRQLDAKRRIYMLRERQKLLVGEWGESILPPGEARKNAAPAENPEAAPARPPLPQRAHPAGGG